MWLPAHLAADGPINGPFTMGYYERDDIPFHFALAENFTVCDGYHSSLLGPTWPNRMYLMTGWIDPNGTAGGPMISNVVPTPPYNWTTYPERLEQAGISWQVYQEEDDYGTNVLEYFQNFQRATPGSGLYRARADDLAAGQVRVRRGPRPVADRLLDRPDLGQVRTPGLPAGDRLRLPGLEARGDRVQPGRLGQDPVHLQLRRERRPVRPRSAAAAARRHPRRVRRPAADRRRRPCAVPPDLAVDGRRLRRDREFRSHLGAPAAGADHRRDRAQHLGLAPSDVRRPDLGARDGRRPRVAGASAAQTGRHQRAVLGGRVRGREPAGADATRRGPAVPAAGEAPAARLDARHQAQSPPPRAWSDGAAEDDQPPAGEPDQSRGRFSARLSGKRSSRACSRSASARS